MSARLIDGKMVAESHKENIRRRLASVEGRMPGLAVIIVGENPASKIYVRNKKKDCEECGINSYEFALPESTTQEELIQLVDRLNKDENVDGIIAQLPLPDHLDADAVINNIDPSKDVDAFHPFNVGQIMIGGEGFVPCTPAGVMALLEAYDISVEGKHSVIVGRSNIVGKPQAMLMLHKNATVTICHSKTPDLAAMTRQADILVAAVGKKGLITADMVKDGAVVIDVAMNRDEAGKLCGDVIFDEVAEKASFITPVPGGVGPMTRVMLLENTLTSFFRRK